MVSKTGTEFADPLNGTPLVDKLFGLAGNDVLKGFSGADDLTGGRDKDQVFGGLGKDNLIVETGDLEAGEIYDGGSGFDTLKIQLGGGAGGDFSFDTCKLTSIEEILAIFGTNGASADLFLSSDSVGGSCLSASLHLIGGSNVLESVAISVDHQHTVDLRGWTFNNWGGGAGDSQIIDSLQNDTIFGSIQSDLVVTTSGKDNVDSGAGNDDVHVGEFKEGSKFLGGSGNDRLSLSGSSTVFDFTNVSIGGFETLRFFVTHDAAVRLASSKIGGTGLSTAMNIQGSNSQDVIEIGVRSDVNFSASGFTFTDFSTGVDLIVIRGGRNANFLTGSSADDHLLGFGGSDTLLGGKGNDLISGGQGDDLMFGGQGNDTYIVDSVGDRAGEILLGSDPGGTDKVEASVTFSLNKFIEKLILTGLDEIDGTGNELDNKIIGNDAANTISGLGGKDLINGAFGADTLSGGAGNNSFVFKSTNESGPGAANRDRILDFLHNRDSIDVSAIDAKAEIDGRQHFRLDNDGNLTTGEFRLRESNGDTFAEFNTDSDSALEMQIQIKDSVSLTVDDFLLS